MWGRLAGAPPPQPGPQAVATITWALARARVRDTPEATIAALAAAASSCAPFMTAQEVALTLAGLVRLQGEFLQPSVIAALLTRLEACTGELGARHLRRALDAIGELELQRGAGLSEGLAAGLQAAVARVAADFGARHRAHVAQSLLALRCAVPEGLSTEVATSAPMALEAAPVRA